MLAVLGVVVAAVAVVALTQQKDTSEDAAKAPSRTITRSVPASSPASSKATSRAPSASEDGSGGSPSGSGSGATSGVKRFPLVVLNNSTVTGLAKRAAKQFEAGGWTITDTANLQNDILSSAAYYDPDEKGAKKAADALRDQFPGIQRVVEKFAELPAGPLVVVVTGDYSTD